MPHVTPLFVSVFSAAIIGGGSIAFPAPSQTIGILDTSSIPVSIACNYAITITRQGGRVLVYRSPRSNAKVVSRLPSNTPVYVCDEQRQWYQVRFSGNCKGRFNNGLREDLAQRCPVGWIRKQNVDVKSG